jgi:hypothetical protein
VNRPETIIERNRNGRAVKVFIIHDNDHRTDYTRSGAGFKASRLERKPQERLTVAQAPDAVLKAFGLKA